MGRLVGDLLDSSAHRQRAACACSRDWCDLQLVLEAAAACVPDGGAIVVTVADDLGPIWGDHDRLEQVFVNLLENAVRHGARRRGRRRHGDARRRHGHGRGRGSRDHGPGIPPASPRPVFQPRVRGGTGAAGAGLGLAIARGIVEAHGGGSRSSPVEPARRFVVTLPAEPSDRPDRLRGACDRAAPSAGPAVIV